MKIVISRKDLRRSTFHCGGPGGQNVNKVETGVRYVHIPTGVVSESRVHKTQGQNDDEAIRLIVKRLREHFLDQRRREAAAAYQAKDDAAFGRQRRSYVLDGKNQRVEDHMTGVTHNQPKAVLDGDLDQFLVRKRN